MSPHSKARDRRLQTGRDGEEGKESRLLVACRKTRNPYLLPIIHLALETAMRQGELVSLRWEHVDLTRRIAPCPTPKTARRAPCRCQPPP